MYWMSLTAVLIVMRLFCALRVYGSCLIVFSVCIVSRLWIPEQRTIGKAHTHFHSIGLAFIVTMLSFAARCITNNSSIAWTGAHCVKRYFLFIYINCLEQCKDVLDERARVCRPCRSM